MNIEDLEAIQKIYSFSKLLEKFEEWIENGVSQDYAGLFIMGYNSLISYPAIILTKDFTANEFYATQKCYDLAMYYGKNMLQELAESEDSKSRATAELTQIPPGKRLLAGCDRFYMLDYLIKAACNGKNLSEIDGNDYAKQWDHILSKGYKDENTGLALRDDAIHRMNSLNYIREMSLSKDNATILTDEHIKQRMGRYYHLQDHNGGRVGCLILFIIGLLVSCI